MRVQCNSLSELLENLSHIQSLETSSIFEDVIRVSITSDEADAYSTIIFHLTAVVQTELHEYVLSYDENCGMDYYDGDGEKAGSNRAEYIKQQIKEFGWTLLPGVIQA